MTKVTVNEKLPIPDSNLTQIVTVTTAGTPVTGADVYNPSGFVFKASPDNTGNVYFMDKGVTKAAGGFPLAAGEPMTVIVDNTNKIDFDAAVNGEKIHILKR